MGGCSPPQLNQYRLHCHISSPVGQARQLSGVYHPVLRADAREVHFTDELDGWWLVRIVIAAVHLQRVDSIFVHALEGIVSVRLREGYDMEHTWGGPRIVPFQFAISMSSPSASPYEHASESVSAQCFTRRPADLYSPAPRPFSPFSSSSSNLKFLGTLAPIVSARGRKDSLPAKRINDAQQNRCVLDRRKS